ncbi:MAG: flagellar biosynthesis anti-sigma factor FlgM [Stellaceae bacterium]
MTDPIRGVLGGNPASEINPASDAKTGNAASGTDTVTGTGTSQADSANVGQTRSLLETINATAASVPTINQNQVESLRQAIQNGSYQVDPHQVAKGLIQADAGLPAPTKE